MKRIGILLRKEILDTLRDRKTLIMMVVVPMLLYPLIIIGMSIAMTAFMQSEGEEQHTIGLSASYEVLGDALERLYEENREDIGLNLAFVRADGQEEAQIRKEADVWLDVSGTEEQLDIRILYASTDQGGRDARSAVASLLDQYSEELALGRLAQAGLPETILHPIVYRSEDSASLSESLGMDIGGSIGMMLIVTILLGALYPAIDATAGEKERGTLETLLTLPVTNFQMITGKYLSVALFACVTAVISLLSLGGSVVFLIYGVAGAELESGMDLTGLLSALPVLLVTMITTALLISALCMCFCVFAKSFKEANNYVTPLLFVIMFASMAAMIPSIQLDYRTALIPIVNVSLMVKQIIGQQFDLMLAGTTILINVVYSIVIVWVLAKIYDSENVLFGDGFRSFRLFESRSNIKKGTVPGTGDVVITVALLFLLILYIGTAVSMHSMIGGTALNQVMILGLPILMAWYMKADFRTLFSLQKPRWTKIPGSIVLYLGTYALVLALSSILTALFPQDTAALSSSFELLTEAPFALILLVTAVLPGLGEELLFRGFLFGSFRARKTVGFAILVSSLIFGAFHMSLVKLLPTALLGACFAVIVASTGSLFVTMCLHCLHNALLMGLLKFPEQAARFVPILTKEEFSAGETAGLLVVGVVVAVIGLWLLREKRAKEQ